MKAIWNDTVIAEADKKDLIYIERNWYFPPGSIKKEYFKPSQTQTTCHWKGLSNYYQVDVNGNKNEDAAWYYPDPLPGSFKVVKSDYTNYVAFWNGVEVSE